MARPAVGDQSVFREIDVLVRISGLDVLAPAVQVSGALVVPEPRILVSVEAGIQINGGEAARRVPGLRVFAGGLELAEIVSATQQPTLEFPFAAARPAHGQSVEIELRLAGSSYFLDVAPPVVELTAPASGVTLPSSQPLVLQWAGTAGAPRRVSVLADEAGCVIGYRQTGADTFVPVRQEHPGSHEPPCRFLVRAEWAVPAALPASPFSSLQLERVTARLARFSVS